jgi:MFS family permease
MGILLSIIINIGLLLLIILFLGIAVFITYPALASFVSEITDENVEGKTFGIIFTLQLGGGTLLLTIGGIFGDLFGIWSSFCSSAFYQPFYQFYYYFIIKIYLQIIRYI